MRNRYSIPRRVFIIVVVTFCVSFAFLMKKVIILLEGENLINEGNRYFTISPDTILTDLLVGRGGVFIPSETYPNISHPDEGEPVQWGIEDYIFISESVNEMAEEGSPGDWKYNMISAQWDCEYFDFGPQSAQFRLIKIHKVKSTSFRIENHITVLPRRDSIMIYTQEYSPVIIKRAIIFPEKLKISMGQAVDIAEENGGNKTRSEVKNQCSFYAMLNPENLSYDGWIIRYLNYSDETLDYYYINPETGSVDEKN